MYWRIITDIGIFELNSQGEPESGTADGKLRKFLLKHENIMLKRVLTRNNLRAFYGGVFATIITAGGIFLVGNLSGWKAKELIEGSIPHLTMLCNTVALASATILALLLTLLGVSSGTRDRLGKDHYRQVLLIARWDTVIFIASIVTFQIVNIPITETKEVDYDMFKWIYWASLAISSILSGAIVSVILLLYNTVRNLIEIVGFDPDEDS